MAPPEDDIDDLSPPSIHQFRRLTGSSRRSSMRLLEDRAFHVQEDHARSIEGRLGGHLDSIRLLDNDKDEQQQQETGVVVSEATGLLLSLSSSSPPPWTAWLLPALLCAAAYAFYNIFIKKGSAWIHPILGGVVLQFVAALLGLVLLLTLLQSKSTSSGSNDERAETIHYDRYGLFWSVCAGLAVGLAEMLSFFVSSLGVQASQFIPIIIGGSVMFGAVLGLMVLGEQMLLWHGWSGVLLLVVGIALVATDSGEKVEETGAMDAAVLPPPPLAVWIAPALVCAAMYAFYNIFIKKGSASINPVLGGVVLQLVAAVFGSCLLGVVMLQADAALSVSGTGFFWACCAGVAVGMAELLSFTVSGMGVDASKSIPIIIGGSVMFGAVLGLLMLGETLKLQGWFGVGLLMTGIALVATDPGEKVAGH